MEAQCTKESGCEHANQVLSLYSRCRPGLKPFEYDPSCCGNSWFLHVMQHGTQVSKGAKGLRKLQEMYKGIVKGKNHPKCDALYLNEAVQHFLQARGIVNHLHEAIDHGKGWFRFEFVQKDPRMESNWLETGFHGFPLECLASILKHGLLESTPDRPGCRFSRGPGIYFTKLIGAAASGYSRFVADREGVFYCFALECLLDRSQRKDCKSKKEWLQPNGSCARVALWVQAAHYDDIASGEWIMPTWIPLLEVPAQAGVLACQKSVELCHL